MVDGRKLFTPMLVVMVAIGTTDLLFALDSIPAIFGLTQEPYLVFTANAFALMGLRQLYFLLGGLLDRLVFLSIGLGGRARLHRGQADPRGAAHQHAAVHQRWRAGRVGPEIPVTVSLGGHRRRSWRSPPWRALLHTRRHGAAPANPRSSVRDVPDESRMQMDVPLWAWAATVGAGPAAARRRLRRGAKPARGLDARGELWSLFYVAVAIGFGVVVWTRQGPTSAPSTTPPGWSRRACRSTTSSSSSSSSPSSRCRASCSNGRC